MNKELTAFFILAGFFGFGCKGSPTESPKDQLIYSNSFETSTDTAGWKGYGSLELVSNAPVGGGAQSARISGGCIFPHAYTTLIIPAGVSSVTLQCWGKCLLNGGGVELHKVSTTGVPYAVISVEISDTVWTFCKSTSSLACTTNDTMILEMNSGGFVPGAMLIDLIEIHSVR